MMTCLEAQVLQDCGSASETRSYLSLSRSWNRVCRKLIRISELVKLSHEGCVEDTEW